jgi:flagellar biosynthetic protein FliR
VLARLGGAVLLLPGLGESELPVTVRLALALALVALLLPVVAARLPPMPREPAELLRLMLLETATGLWIGLLARLVVIALAQAGQVIGLMIGLASPLQGDALFGAQGIALSRLLGLLGVVLVLGTGLYAVPLRALVETYVVLPPGAPLPAGPVAESVALAAGESLALAIRLAGPFVLLAALGNLGLALLARVAPQVQVFILAMPAQILAGILLLALLMPALLQTFEGAAAEALAVLPGLR